MSKSTKADGGPPPVAEVVDPRALLCASLSARMNGLARHYAEVIQKRENSARGEATLPSIFRYTGVGHEIIHQVERGKCTVANIMVEDASTVRKVSREYANQFGRVSVQL